jgi:D-glycero-alpha-D-manno-heptose 1-phosphate guanylyltransferase
MNHNHEAIILAGGLGTRLRETVPDLPKCMAPVAGRPFLFYVINHLRMQGVGKFIFSLGYRHETIQEYLDARFSTLDFQSAIEDEPLGTGGAIQLAIRKALSQHVIITNGDTLFKISVPELSAFHLEKQSDCTLALKPMQNFDRYGVVELGKDGEVTSFREKKFYPSGNINGGTYILNREKFLGHLWPEKFSFEKDYLEKKIDRLYGRPGDAYFIDIGVPEDYERARHELKQDPLDLRSIDKNWTLFLDRDGVINKDKPGSYIFSPDEFQFLDGAPALFKKLSEKFARIIVVTNQRGVGRGLMSEDTLKSIHQKMETGILKAGGRIDRIYYCTAVNKDHPLRKPNPGMAAMAKIDFPEIDFSRSIMVGNNMSDMHFGKNAGMYTVFVKTTIPDPVLPHLDIDLVFESLQDFAKAL